MQDLLKKKVEFTEDEWVTLHKGFVKEETFGLYYIESKKYGNRWIPKENVRELTVKSVRKVKA